jgi:hypothetical protein
MMLHQHVLLEDNLPCLNQQAFWLQVLHVLVLLDESEVA